MEERINPTAELAKCEAATPGIWKYSPKLGDIACNAPGRSHTTHICESRHWGAMDIDTPEGEEHDANARFIAAARTGYPAALRELVALQQSWSSSTRAAEAVRVELQAEIVGLREQLGEAVKFRDEYAELIIGLRRQIQMECQRAESAEQQLGEAQEAAAYAPENAWHQLTKDGIEFYEVDEDGEATGEKRKLVWCVDKGDSSVGIGASHWWQAEQQLADRAGVDALKQIDALCCKCPVPATGELTKAERTLCCIHALVRAAMPSDTATSSTFTFKPKEPT